VANFGLVHTREFVYLDMEKPSDYEKLATNAEWFLGSQKDKLIIIDEVQHAPELFPLIRSLCDEWGGVGRFLLLGSASRDLLNKSSESLAGRVSYKKLSPFLWNEIKEISGIEDYIFRG
jgi:predicted AAA+ superfamily ATPase